MEQAHPLTAYRNANGQTLADLATKLGVHPPAVSKWENGRVPAERVLDVERITGVSRYELRPDIYGPAPEPHTSKPGEAA